MLTKPHNGAAPLFQALVHADWSVAARKRWLARGVWDRGWTIQAVEPVGPTDRFLDGLLDLGSRGPALAGFDFPIGTPRRYGAATGLPDFRALVEQIGRGRWADFAEIARLPEEISVEKPFYPRGVQAGLRQASLLEAHGATNLDDLRRACERATEQRRAACPLFWTLGGNKVGRAALSGWREIVRPALAEGAALWPFDGRLDALATEPRLVIAETYPAEAYGHVGVRFRPGESKTSQTARRDKAQAILGWAHDHHVELAPPVALLVADGFGADRAGEDRFDALMGLLGMIEVVDGRRSEGPPPPCAWEGWILGQPV